jgi:protein-arginine kinase activator protein McsA
MLCCICKARKASVHLTQVQDGQTHKYDLCHECTEEMGLDGDKGFSLTDLFEKWKPQQTGG